MPKVPMYTLAWSSTTEAYELYQTRNREALRIVPDSHEWFAWLDLISSFAFESIHRGMTFLLDHLPNLLPSRCKAEPMLLGFWSPLTTSGTGTATTTCLPKSFEATSSKMNPL